MLLYAKTMVDTNGIALITLAGDSTKHYLKQVSIRKQLRGAVGHLLCGLENTTYSHGYTLLKTTNTGGEAFGLNNKKLGFK